MAIRASSGKRLGNRMTDKKTLTAQSGSLTVRIPERNSISVSTISTSNSSGLLSIVNTLPLPDGQKMHVLNRDVFDRALKKVGELKK
jgi:hypothetical protein